MATKKSASTAAATAAAPALAPKKAAPAKKATTAASTVAPAKKAAPKKKAAVLTPSVATAPAVSFEILQDQIRVEAYGYYIERGYRPGDPTADWHRAEDAVLRRHGLR